MLKLSFFANSSYGFVKVSSIIDKCCDRRRENSNKLKSWYSFSVFSLVPLVKLVSVELIYSILHIKLEFQ